MTETIDRKPEARKEKHVSDFRLVCVWKGQEGSWRVITRIVMDYFFYHEDISLSRIILLSHGESRRVFLSRICELFFTRRIADGHGGFLWHETFTLDILTNGKEFAN